LTKEQTKERREMKKSILSIIFTLAMVVLLLPLNSLPVYAAETTATDFTTLKNAISNAAEGDTIVIAADIMVTEKLLVNESLTFTASGSGKLTRHSSFTNDCMFYIDASGKTVTFTNITIDGNGSNVTANRPGINVATGELIFQSGAVLQNCKNSSGYGGGISIGGEAGKFTMTGGTIQNNYSARYGGGVHVANNGNFTMTGGSIINNSIGNTGLGGGIQIGMNCPVKLSGDVQIHGNKKLDGSADNLYIENNSTLELTGALTNATPIGVRMESAGIFTSGTAVENNTFINQFTSDISAYAVGAEGNQLKLVPNIFPVTITANRDDVAWTGHGKSFKLVKSGTDYTDLTAIPGGTYDVYEGTTDTGVNVTVNGAAVSATVDYYTVALTAGEGITSTSGAGTYLKGSSPVINATVNSTYNWSKWTQTTGGVELSTTNSYTIANIQSTQSYTAMAVKAPPAIGNIPDQSPVLTGVDLNEVLTKPVVSAGAYTIASQGWQCSADGNTNWYNIPVGSTCSAALNGYYLRYYATYNDSGTKIVYSPGTKQITINRYASTLTLEVTPASPQFSGSTIILKASISGGIHMTAQGYLDTAPVIFKSGTTTLGTAKISATTGVATYETTTLAVGDHSFTAEFPGDSDFNAPATSNMVNYSITVAPDPDIAVVNNAKSTAEGASYANMTQLAAISETVITDAMKTTAGAAVNNSSVTVIINQDSFTLPIAGTSANPSGTDGSYVFRITVSKGAQSQTTGQKTIRITATPFTGISDVQAIAAAKTELVDGTANVAFGADQVTKTAAVQAYVNGILSGTADASGVTATVTYNNATGKYDVALNKGSINDSKSLTMMVNEAPAPTAPAPAGSPQTTETKTETKTITVVEVPQSIPGKEFLTVEPVGEAFDNSVEVRLKEDTITEGMVRTAMEAVSSALNIENAQIFPLDISIYLKGTNTKVQPKEGTAVMITCPIPTEMLTNMEKLVVVCVIDGKLQVLATTLVTKDGVPCVQFTANHFSPYAIVIDKDNNLADYAAGTLPDAVTYLSAKLTANAGTVTKVDLEGIKEGSTITYHVCTPTLISTDNNGNLFAKKAGNAVLMANVTHGGASTIYTIRVTVKNTKGGTKVGLIRYYDDIVVYNKINYRITAKATDKVEGTGTVAVANNQINKDLPNKLVIPATIIYKGKTYKVTSIDESAFYNQNKMTSVSISAGVEEISATAFVSCDSLKTFTVSSDNKYYSAKRGMLLNKEGTTLIAYPSAKGTIVIEKKIAVIGSYAFSACKYLTGVVIPKTVTRIEGCAFCDSKSLTNVTFHSMTVPEIPYLCIFEKVNEHCSIRVPETSLLKYQVAFKNARMPKGARVDDKK
jgi:hypothetical protein